MSTVPVLHVVLLEPQIPPNTGTIARTCAATDTKLHIVGPTGFSLSDKSLRRAGLDYWPFVQKRIYAHWSEFIESAPEEGIQRIHSYSTKAKQSYTEAQYSRGDAFLFGREDRGLPWDLSFGQIPQRWWLVPINRSHVRSINLAVCAGVVVFEALRQIGVSPCLSQTEISDPFPSGIDKIDP